MRPSRTKIGSDSTRTPGYVLASVSHDAQWVVARLPLRRPAAARMNVPVHTEPSRLTRGAIRASHARKAGSCAAVREPRPPATRSVSTLLRTSRKPRFATIAMPEDVSIGPAVGPTISVSYTHLRAHETPEHLVCRLLLEK